MKTCSCFCCMARKRLSDIVVQVTMSVSGVGDFFGHTGRRRQGTAVYEEARKEREMWKRENIYKRNVQNGTDAFGRGHHMNMTTMMTQRQEPQEMTRTLRLGH